MANAASRPIAFVLKGGQVADCKATSALLEHRQQYRILYAGKGYDTNHIRRTVGALGTMPNIPPKANWLRKACFSPCLYRDRNAIERIFSHLTDFR